MRLGYNWKYGPFELIDQLGPAWFRNRLRAEGRNLFTETDTSGTPQTGTPGQDGFGELSQGFLESSNVNVVEELVSMIAAQRAYEINSRAVSAADEMLRSAAAIVR